MSEDEKCEQIERACRILLDECESVGAHVCIGISWPGRNAYDDRKLCFMARTAPDVVAKAQGVFYSMQNFLTRVKCERIEKSIEMFESLRAEQLKESKPVEPKVATGKEARHDEA